MEVNVWAIFFSFLINFLRRSSSKVCSFLVDKIYHSADSAELLTQNVEVITYQREKDSYSPIDEFAKYALADRKLNKALDKVAACKTKIRAFKMKKMVFFNVAYTIMIGVMSVSLIWSNYDKPIIDFSNLVETYASRRRDPASIATNLNDTLSHNVTHDHEYPIIFYPLNNFLAFPSTHRKNSIGVTVWLFFVNRFIEICINKYTNRVKTE